MGVSLTTKTKYAAGLALHAAAHPSDLRHLSRWKQYLKPSPLESRVPWLAFSAVDYLRRYAVPGSKVFEFGGGGSTAWFADRGAHVITVEHDPEWAAMIKRAVQDVDLREREDSPEYPAAIDDDADDSFDIVLIDGRRRTECAEHAMSKVRYGGILVFDDTDVAKHASVFELLADWPQDRFVGLSAGKAVRGHTTVFHRPLAR